jgi:arylsulfatase A-like enzyme
MRGMAAVQECSGFARRRMASALTGVLAVFLCAACGADPVPRIQHVIVVVLDTTHAGHLGCAGGPASVSPHLDALAARGVRFAEARSNTTWTLPSTVSLLTGLHQETHGVVTANDRVPDDLPLLTERLGEAGFDVAFISQMIFASNRHGFKRGSDEFSYHGKNAGATTFHAAVTERISNLGHGPTLTYLHFRRPHSPYDPSAEFLAPFEKDCPLADGSRDKALRFVDGERGPLLSSDEQAHLVHLYRGGLREVDSRVGGIVELLGDRLSSDTLLVVTSDHGEGLGEHDDYGHGDRLHGEHVRIPLILVGPGLDARVVEQPVGTVDVAPTLYELLDIAPPGPMEGESFARLLEGVEVPREPVRLSGRWYPGTTPDVGAVGERWTVLQRSDTDVTVYDRRTDPMEEHPLDPSQVDDPELRHLLEITRSMRAHRPRAPDVPAPGLTRDQLEELRRLGYVK